MSVFAAERADVSSCPASSRDRVVIAFVNNMPDAAIRSSERQFRGMLQAAAGDADIVFENYYYSGLPRTEAALTDFLQSYRDIDTLWDNEVDGLIVTGAEPRATCLVDEPFWPLMSRLTCWAEDHAIASIWSCLAAHAAIFRLAGVSRQRLSKKLSGLFECKKAPDHPLTIGTPEKWLVPHSRYNDMPEAELLSHGFQPVTSIESGLDIFTKQSNSFFVFFQGHPEYDSDSLILEYLRDVRYFIEGKRETYPDPPAGYFDAGILDNLEECRLRAAATRAPDCLTDVSRAIRGESVANTWRSPAEKIYRNWLTFIIQEKRKQRQRESGLAASGQQYATV